MSDGAHQGALAARVARAAGALAIRQGGVLLLGAIGVSAITRPSGPADYGEYALAIATWSSPGAAADFGFSFTLARDLANDPELHRPMLRSAYRVWGRPGTRSRHHRRSHARRGGRTLDGSRAGPTRPRAEHGLQRAQRLADFAVGQIPDEPGDVG